MGKDGQSPKPKVVEMERGKCIPFSKGMSKKVVRMNTIANTLADVAKGLEDQAQKAQVDLQDYLSYCRDELNAPEALYELKRIDTGFELKEQEGDLDGIH